MFWNPAVNLLVLLKVGGAILVCMAVRMGAIVEPLRSCKPSDKDRHRVDRRTGPTTPLLAQGSVTNLLTFNADLNFCQKMKGPTTMGQPQLKREKGAPHYSNRPDWTYAQHISNSVQVRASRTQNVALLPFLDGELFLSGQHQPLGTISLQWHTAGWHRCYSNSGCGRWPWFSSPWFPRTTNWLLLHAAVVGGGTRFVLSPVSTTWDNTQDREAQRVWSTQLIGEGRWKRVDEK